MDLVRHLGASKGFFTRAEALGVGYDDRDLARARRAGVIARIRHGSYAFRDLWDPLGPEQQHLVRARSVMQGIRGEAVLSHLSGAIAHGMVTWGLPLTRVHVTRLDGGAGRIEGDVVHHEGRCGDDEPVEVGALPVLPAIRCAIETGIIATPESALVVLDSFLHRGLGSYDELLARFAAMQRWPGTRHLHVPARMADGGADGAGESRARWLFRSYGVPAPVLQYPVRDGERVVGVSDWAWPDAGLLGEFDGRVKYGRLVRTGSSAADVVFAEKRREDRMREVTGWSMIRLTWADLERPRGTAERIHRALRRAG